MFHKNLFASFMFMSSWNNRRTHIECASIKNNFTQQKPVHYQVNGFWLLTKNWRFSYYTQTANVSELFKSFLVLFLWKTKMILSSKEKHSLFRGIITTDSFTSDFPKTPFSFITPNELLQKMTSLKKESRGQLFTHHRFNVCLVIRDDKARKSIDAKLTRSSS